MKFKVITGTIEVLTGLHVGAGKDTIEIGGLDNPVLRDPATKEPYIPGSSIKGKMRSFMEWHKGEVAFDKFNRRDVYENKPGEPHSCNREDCIICKVFGSSSKEPKRGPTRLIVRDAYLSREARERFREGKPVTENKYENAINRITGEANPRPMERVVRGVKFDFEMVYRIFDEGDNQYFHIVPRALKALEQDALGGCSSRGCGKIRFLDIKVDEKSYHTVDEWLESLGN